LIKIQLFSIAKVNKLNETYELLQILNCHKFVWWEGNICIVANKSTIYY
jgi:hypothetical protein